MKIIALPLFCLLLFAACTGKDAAEPTPSPAQSAAEPAPVAPMTAPAEPAVQEPVPQVAQAQHFEGSIKGYQTADYPFSVEKGQNLHISMATFYPAAYFLVYSPENAEEALFNSALQGEQFEGIAQASGEYRVRIYMMRAQARRNEVAKYRLEIITGSLPAQ